jgi:hypothetical protein
MQVGEYMEVQAVAVCKTVGSAYVGSNPTPANIVMSQVIEDTGHRTWRGIAKIQRKPTALVTLCPRRARAGARRAISEMRQVADSVRLELGCLRAGRETDGPVLAS